MTVYDHVKSAMQRVTETTWWQVTWESDSWRPRHSPSPRQRRTLRHRELQKNQRAQCADCEKDSKNTRGSQKFCPGFEEELLGEASSVHTSPFCETSEHSSRCVITSKTKRKLPLPWSTTYVATKRSAPGSEARERPQSRMRIVLRSRVYPDT